MIRGMIDDKSNALALPLCRHLGAIAETRQNAQTCIVRRDSHYVGLLEKIREKYSILTDRAWSLPDRSGGAPHSPIARSEHPHFQS